MIWLFSLCLILLKPFSCNSLYFFIEVETFQAKSRLEIRASIESYSKNLAGPRQKGHFLLMSLQIFVLNFKILLRNLLEFNLKNGDYLSAILYKKEFHSIATSLQNRQYLR